MTSPDVIAERYGLPSRFRRRALVAGCIAVAAVFLGGLAWIMVTYSRPEVESDLLAFDVLDEHTVTARVAVDRRDEDVEATCLVRAFSADHATVGEVSWTPEGDARAHEDVTIRTERAATSVELVGCTADGQPRPR